MAAIRQTFFQECEEGLGDLEAGLLAMEGGQTDGETVNAVFRAVHSIKGGAGAFSLDALVRFAHVFETTLDDIRSGRLAADANVVATLLRANDVLADLVAVARDGGEADDARVQAIKAELQGFGDGEPEAEEGDDGMGDFVFQPVAIGAPAAPVAASPVEPAVPAADAPVAPAAGAGGAQGWTIRFTPAASLYANANDPGLLFRELGRLGTLTAELDASALPALEVLNPEAAYLSWTLHLQTDKAEADIREVFDFVEGDCELSVTRDGGPADAAPAADGGLDVMALIAMAKASVEAPAFVAPDEPLEPAPAPVSAAEPPADGGVDVAALIAMAKASVEPPSHVAPDEPMPAVLADAPAPASAVPAPTKPAAAAPARAPAAAAPALATTTPPAAATRAEAAPGATIRVDLDRVDRLIDLVGELVINQAMLTQRIAEAGLQRSSAAGMALDELEHLTRDIQDSVMAIRAQPVKSVFQRMPRLVRETAAMVSKQVRLVTEGENTEVDKTVIERLSEPLTHMIRNSIDHGIESPEKRTAAGKPAEGVVRLSALHRSGRIVIEIADDGAGINRPRVRQIAVDKGLIAADAQLTDEEIDNLIFMPGFSTAEVVSDVSGRGVGMDVVRRSIQALGGRITIASRPGEGSTFTLSLPLTLAVLDGMVVSVGDQTLVAPLTAMIESLQPKPANVHAFAEGRVINIRDAYLPLIDVGVALGYRPTPLNPGEGVALLVEAEGGARAALVVDAIQGQRQVVIKSLESNYRHVPGIAAATILGDGRVALILDVDTVVARGKGAEAPRRDPAPPAPVEAPPLALAS